MPKNAICFALLAVLYFDSSLALALNNSTVITAVGEYDSKDALGGRDTTFYPLLLQSYDGGATWSSKSMKTILPKNYHGYGIFNSIYCDKSNCLLAGNYRDRNDDTHPLLYKSSDSGKYWSLVTALPKDYLNGGTFKDVNCDNTICIAVGRYRNKKEDWQPLLAISHNAGQHWFYPESVITNIPTHADRGVFTKGYCKDQVCTTVGQYHLGINTTMTLLAKSTDGGLTWHYVSTLPDDYSYHGTLKNITIHG